MRIELRPETADEIAAFQQNNSGGATAFTRINTIAFAAVQVSEKGLPKDILYVHGNPMLAARKLSDLLAQLFMTNGPVPMPVPQKAAAEEPPAPKLVPAE